MIEVTIPMLYDQAVTARVQERILEALSEFPAVGVHAEFQPWITIEAPEDKIETVKRKVMDAWTRI